MSRIDAILERLGGLYPRTIDLSLDRVRGLMARLGNPQDRLPPVIHVAGTNGKGSTVAFLRACLEAAGYRVHVYTSPHLVRFAERIRLAGRLISDEALLALLDEVERCNAGDPITLFEVTTVAAFLAFSRTPADVVLLETGLGGRLDATNVVAAPAVTAITPVSMDHMSFLGNTVAAIAGEKAGILKPHRPAVIARQVPDADAVIAARAATIGAPLFRQDKEWSAVATASGWRYSSRNRSIDLPPPGLAGAHQIGNAGCAIACLEQLAGFTVDASAMATGMANVYWPARMQRLLSGPINDLLGPAFEVWLDGGHNPAAGEILGTTVATWAPGPLHLVVGMLSNRDPAEFLAPLSPYVASIRAVTIPGEENAHRADAIVALLAASRIAASAADSVMDAVAAIRDDTGPAGGRVLICGSLYLAGQVLAAQPSLDDRE
jgi:dihydrofolate synthase / folylpolyglutamate synthase